MPDESELIAQRAEIDAALTGVLGAVDRQVRLARVIGPVLKRLYPQNPDIVLGREAMAIAEAIIAGRDEEATDA